MLTHLDQSDAGELCETGSFEMATYLKLIALAAFILAASFMLAPRATMITNEASTEVLGIDILGLTKQHKDDLPTQQYAAH
jgi:hypothetical protein